MILVLTLCFHSSLSLFALALRLSRETRSCRQVGHRADTHLILLKQINLQPPSPTKNSARSSRTKNSARSTTSSPTAAASTNNSTPSNASQDLEMDNDDWSCYLIASPGPSASSSSSSKRRRIDDDEPQSTKRVSRKDYLALLGKEGEEEEESDAETTEEEEEIVFEEGAGPGNSWEEEAEFTDEDE